MFGVEELNIIRIYIAITGRGPSAAELDDAASNLNLVSLSASLLSAQTIGRPAVSDAAFIDSLYDNLLGRPADTAGRAFWLDELLTVSRSEVARHFQFAASFNDEPGLEQRLALAEAFIESGEEVAQDGLSAQELAGFSAIEASVANVADFIDGDLGQLTADIGEFVGQMFTPATVDQVARDAANDAVSALSFMSSQEDAAVAANTVTDLVVANRVAIAENFAQILPSLSFDELLAIAGDIAQQVAADNPQPAGLTPAQEAVFGTFLAVQTNGAIVEALLKAANEEYGLGLDVPAYMAPPIPQPPTLANLLDATDASVAAVGALAVPAAEAISDIVNAEPVGEVVALTTANDVITTGNGDDVITGVASSLATERTLNPGDQIDGGAGNDTLEATLRGDFGGFTGEGFMRNVENIVITNDSSIIRTFNARGIEDLETIEINASKAGVRLQNLAENGLQVGLNDQASGSFDIGFSNDAFDDVDVPTLFLAANNVGRFNAAGETISRVNINAQGILETEITSKGDANAVNLAGMSDLQTLVIAGDGNTVIEGVSGQLRQVDGAGSTGDLSLDLTNAGALTQINGGAGNDVFRVDVDGGLAVNAEINGGGGRDTLILNGSGTIQPLLANIHTLQFDEGVDGNMVISGVNIESLEQVVLRGQIAGNITLANIDAQDRTVQAVNASGFNDFNYISAGLLTFNVAAANSDVIAGTSSVTNLTLNATESSSLVMNVNPFADFQGRVVASEAQNIELNVATAKSSGSNPVELTRFAGEIIANNASGVLVNASGSLQGRIVAQQAESIEINSGATSSSLSLDAQRALSAVVDAAGDFSFDHFGTDLSNLETLQVNTMGAFSVGRLDAMNQLSVSGLGANSSAFFSGFDLADAENDFDLTVNATGLSGGLDISNVSLMPENSFTLNAGSVSGSVFLNNVNIDAQLDENAPPIPSGDIGIDVNGTNGSVFIGSLLASSVTVNATNALGNVTIGNVTADTAALSGSSLQRNSINVDASESATVTGGIQSDVIRVTGTAEDGDTSATMFSLTGGLGNDTFAVDVNGGKVRTIITDFNNGNNRLDVLDLAGAVNVTQVTGEEALGNAKSIIINFLLSAENAPASASDITNVFELTNAVVEGAGSETDIRGSFLFQFAGSTHAIIQQDGANLSNNEFDAGDLFVTLQGVTGVSDTFEASDIFNSGGSFFI